MVTGVDVTTKIILGEDLAANEEHARDLVRIIAAQKKSPVSWTELFEQSGKPKTTFKRGLDEATKVKGWLIGLKGGYALNPDESWKQALAGSGAGSDGKVQGPPHRGVDPVDPISRSVDPIGPKVDLGPNPEGENPPKPPENEVELEKWREMMRSLDKYR
jgi:hypothetical protein